MQAEESSRPAGGRPARLLDAVFFVLLLLACEIALSAIVEPILHVRTRGNLVWAAERAASFAVVFLVISKRLGGSPAGYIGTSSPPAAVYGLVVAGVLGIHFFVGPIDALLRRAVPFYDFYGDSYLPHDIVGTVLVSIVISPAIEEFLFRGVALRGFSRNYRIPTALVLSSLLFALSHHNPAQFIGPFCSGLLFGAAFLRANSILPCLVGHVLTNGMWFLARANRDVAELWSLGAGGDEPALLAVRVVLGVLLAALSITLLLRPRVFLKD